METASFPIRSVTEAHARSANDCWEGLRSRAAEPGAPVPEGAPLGHALDLFGGELEAMTSPVDAAVAGICTYGSAPAEDYVAELAHGFHVEGPPA